MAWFEYLPKDYTDPENGARIRPPFRIGLEIQKLYSEVKKDRLFFVNITNSGFYTYFDTNPKKQIDNTQYVVVFHPNDNTNESTVVRSNINDGVLYFLSAVDHPEGLSVVSKYYVYYGKPFLKYVSAIDENSAPKTYVEASDSIISQVIAYNVECD